MINLMLLTDINLVMVIQIKMMKIQKMALKEIKINKQLPMKMEIYNSWIKTSYL